MNKEENIGQEGIVVRTAPYHKLLAACPCADRVDRAFRLAAIYPCGDCFVIYVPPVFFP